MYELDLHLVDVRYAYLRATDAARLRKTPHRDHLDRTIVITQIGAW